jgi:hypothetical protein
MVEHLPDQISLNGLVRCILHQHWDHTSR